MATQNVVAGGGRASGGSVVSPTEITRQAADNTGVSATGGNGGTGGFRLPDLDASVVDELFREDDNRGPTGGASPETGESVAPQRRDTLGAGEGRRGFNNPNSRYARMGWDLGWNSVGSNITRGAAAFGLRENPAYSAGEGEGANAGPRGGPRYQNLREIAQFAGVDTAGYTNPDGTLNEDGLKAAVDGALKDYYLVSGDTGGIPGYSGAQPFRFASSLYRRDGNTLRAVSGTARTFNAPENQAGGHFAEYLAPVVSILAAPLLSGFGITGQAGALTTSISNATGLSPFWSNVLGTGLVRGTLGAAGGGDFIRGAIGGAVGAGVSPYISAGAAELAGPGTTAASLLTGAGNLGLSAILNGGRITPMGAVSSLMSGFRGNRNGERNR